jgi:hypothetical protein
MKSAYRGLDHLGINVLAFALDCTGASWICYVKISFPAQCAAETRFGAGVALAIGVRLG